MMTRTHRTGICPDCNQLPKESASGVLVCACPDKNWYRTWGVQGTEQETTSLKRYGFELAQDIQADNYYCGPTGHIIWLYADGTWHSDKADPGVSMQGYLDWIEQLSCQAARV